MSNTPFAYRLRNKRRGQRGQALPLGALGLLIMALAVIMTLNLGQAVHEKIRLQNSADAAAYSLAAMEARAFNFIALLNRTQIVHYNTAMALQSYLSYAGYCLAMFGTVKDLLVDLSLAIETGTKFPTPANIPYVAIFPVFKVMAQVAHIIYTVIDKVYEFLHLGTIPTIEAMGIFNKAAIWQMQFIRALQINAHLITGMQDFVIKNDPAMTYTGTNQMYNIMLNQVLNSLEFRQTFDRGAGLNPFWLDSIILGYKDMRAYKPNPTDEKVEDAQKIMAEIANSSRSNKNIYNRSLAGFGLTSWVVASIMGKKMGQTRFVSKGQKAAPQVEEIRTEKEYPVGDTLASDDFLSMSFGYAFAGIAGVVIQGGSKVGDGIVASKEKNDRKHYKYVGSGGGTTGGAPEGFASLVVIFPFPTGNIKRTFKKNDDQDHAWPGLAPYFKFNPSSERNSDFNQPSTWIFLNKHHSAFQSGSGSRGRPWHYNFTWKNSGGSANAGISKEGEKIGGAEYKSEVSLDTTIGGARNHFLLEGLNVISRGMVYYHRPGEWGENPNLFNPFWRARLAPVGAKLMNVWDRFLGSKITTSSDSRVAKMVVNFVRNFVSDVFLRTVTGVMTH